MDGFAVRAFDTRNARPDSPLNIPVIGTVAAGQQPITGIAERAVEIMTGAPVPSGYDTVIPVERIDAERDANDVAISISIFKPISPDQHIRHAGQDFRLGQSILSRGQVLEPHHIMGLAATGSDTVATIRQPRIAIITTGSELATSGVPSAGGLIRDANGPYLRSFLAYAGAKLVRTESVTDDEKALESAIETCSEDADVILTTGGVSAGRFDLVPDAVKALGGEIIFHKVAMRPGKPLLFARLENGTLFFGLPGNPVAVAVGLRFFVVPALFHLQGIPVEHFLPTTCAESINTRKDLTFFGKARTEPDANGCLQTRLLPGQESFKINSLMNANCWVIVPQGSANIAPGECIEVAPLYPTGFPR